MKGILTGNIVILTDQGGKLVRELTKPPTLDGYKTVGEWVDTGVEIQKQWHYEPVEGSRQEAAIALAKMYIADHTLNDDQALKVSALYPQWDGNGVAYNAHTRILYKGELYNVLQSHRSQADWTPDTASSLFAKVLPGQDGHAPTTIGWVQPDSTNPYKKGDRVTHNGKTWESTSDGNVWEPGTVGAPWKEMTA